MLQRLSKLYQLNNWTEENAVYLAEWISENYKFDSLDDVIVVLSNPPITEQKQWRLTPDTIREWMAIQLEKTAEKMEKEHQKNKEKSIEVLTSIDYGKFKERLNSEGLPKKDRGFNDETYKQLRNEYLAKKHQAENNANESAQPSSTTKPGNGSNEQAPG